MGLDNGCPAWYYSYVRSEKGIRMSIQRTLIETKYKVDVMTERYTKYILWQTDHYQYEVDIIATFNYRKFTKTVKLNQMAYEEAIKVFKEESTEKAFKAARTTRDYLDERPIRNDVDAFAMMYKR
jgi:hypothetical protein